MLGSSEVRIGKDARPTGVETGDNSAVDGSQDDSGSNKAGKAAASGAISSDASPVTVAPPTAAFLNESSPSSIYCTPAAVSPAVSSPPHASTPLADVTNTPSPMRRRASTSSAAHRLSSAARKLTFVPREASVLVRFPHGKPLQSSSSPPRSHGGRGNPCHKRWHHSAVIITVRQGLLKTQPRNAKEGRGRLHVHVISWKTLLLTAMAPNDNLCCSNAGNGAFHSSAEQPAAGAGIAEEASTTVTQLTADGAKTRQHRRTISLQYALPSANSIAHCARLHCPLRLQQFCRSHLQTHLRAVTYCLGCCLLCSGRPRASCPRLYSAPPPCIPNPARRFPPASARRDPRRMNRSWRMQVWSPEPKVRIARQKLSVLIGIVQQCTQPGRVEGCLER